MSSHPKAGSGRQVIKRWQALAERRLDYLTELFESGRWRRFHTEMDFLDNIREAKAAVERWQAMAIQEATPDNHPVTWSWLDSSSGGLPALEPILYQAPRRRAPRPILVETVALAESPSLQPGDRPARGAGVTPADLDWKRALDPAVLGERYPMLRAAAL